MRPLKIFLPVLAAILFFAGPVAKAQENLIEVEDGSFQTESMRKFLRDHRLEWRKSKIDVSGIVKKFRQDLKNIQQERSRTLQVTRNFKPPVLIHRKTDSGGKENVERSEPSVDLKQFIPESNFYEFQKPRPKEEFFNLEERKRRADIKNASQEKILRAQNTALGQLLLEIKTEPLKSHQAELTRFSEKIRKLHGQLQEGRGVQRTVFLDLGNAYLESHQYLNALSAPNRLKLTGYADHSGITLGSHESALWVFNMALARDPNDGETNFTIGKILSDMGEQDLALRRVKNARYLFGKNNQPDRVQQTLGFMESLKSVSSEK